MTTDTEIKQIRLAVLRTLQELQGARNEAVRPLDLMHHPRLKDEPGKRVMNTLFNARYADKALVVSDVRGHYELTAAGRDYLEQHAADPLDEIPVFGQKRRSGRECHEKKPLAMRESQLPPPPMVKARKVDVDAIVNVQPGAAPPTPEELIRHLETLVPASHYLEPMVAELERRAQAAEAEAQRLRRLIAELTEVLT